MPPRSKKKEQEAGAPYSIGMGHVKHVVLFFEFGEVHPLERDAAFEHTWLIGDFVDTEIWYVEGGQSGAAEEHTAHHFHVGGVEMRKVERGQSRATGEHAPHVGDTGGVEMFESFDGGEFF